MSAIKHLGTAIFTSTPGALFLFLTLTSGQEREYYWLSILSGAWVLFGSSFLFGFILPIWLRPKWLWIIAAGFLAMLLALFAVAMVNTTPLCVGQNNGDGNNDFGMCMAYVVLYALFYGVPYTAMLTVSALVSHWVVSMNKRISL